jgi:hypothetical protein
MVPISPAQPRRVKGAVPQSQSRRAKRCGGLCPCVEPVRDARTQRADIFTILLDAASPPPNSCQGFFHMKLDIVIGLMRQDGQQRGDDL